MSLRAQHLVCLAGIIAGIVASYVFLGLTPSLLAHHTVLLETVVGNTASLVTGGALARIGRAPIVLVTLAPLAGIALYDVFYWWAGRLWGDTIVARYAAGRPRRARWAARLERWVRHRGLWVLAVAYFLPIPNVMMYALCGTSGMPLALFVLGDVIGTLLWVGLLVGLGWAVGHPAVRAVDAINHDALLVTVGLVALLVVVAVVRRRRGLRGRAGAIVPAVEPQPTTPERSSGP